MALFRDEDGELNWDAIVWLLIGGWAIRRGLKPVDPFVLAFGGVTLLTAVGKGLRARWGDWLICLISVGGLGLAVVMLIKTSFSLKWALIGAAAVWGFWLSWKDVIRAPAKAADSDKPLISLVLLLNRPRYLESVVLAQSAWGGDYTNEDESKRDGFVVGEGMINLIKSPMGLFTVNNFASPYWQDGDKVAAALADLRLRKVVQDHQAWLSVDLLSGPEDDPQHAAAFAVIVRLLHELVDDSVIGILRPETGRVSAWSDDVLEELLRPHGEDRFHQAASLPVIQVAADDPEMLAAVAEARRRWPEFVAAYAGRKDGDFFSVKAPVTAGGNTEFIWIKVDGLEPDYVHGTLGNDPVDLGDLKFGSRVEVPVAEINDWAIRRDEEILAGLFTVAAVVKRQKSPPNH